MKPMYRTDAGTSDLRMWFEIKKNDAKRIVKRMGWESLADFLNNYTWDDTEILYQIADNCGMIVADWIEREVEDGRN